MSLFQKLLPVLALAIYGCNVTFPTCVKMSQACEEQALAWCDALVTSNSDCWSAYEAQCPASGCVSYEEQIVCLAEIDKGAPAPPCDGCPPVPPLACQVTWLKH